MDALLMNPQFTDNVNNPKVMAARMGVTERARRVPLGNVLLALQVKISL